MNLDAVGTYVYVRDMPTVEVDPSGEFILVVLALPALPAIAGALVATAKVAAIGTALLGAAVAGAHVGSGLGEMARPKYPESQPTYDPRQDAEAWLRQRQLEAQMYSGHQGSLGGGAPNSSWCKAHPRACAIYRAGAVIATGSMIFGAFHGRNPEDSVVSESPK